MTNDRHKCPECDTEVEVIILAPRQSDYFRKHVEVLGLSCFCGGEMVKVQSEIRKPTDV